MVSKNLNRAREITNDPGFADLSDQFQKICSAALHAALDHFPDGTQSALLVLPFGLDAKVAFVSGLATTLDDDDLLLVLEDQVERIRQRRANKAISEAAPMSGQPDDKEDLEIPWFCHLEVEAADLVEASGLKSVPDPVWFSQAISLSKIAIELQMIRRLLERGEGR